MSLTGSAAQPGPLSTCSVCGKALAELVPDDDGHLWLTTPGDKPNHFDGRTHHHGGCCQGDCRP